jgi:hypothetical protein
VDVNIKLIKKISNIVFEDKNKYQKAFAKELATNGFQVREAYIKSFQHLDKIRASTLLEAPETMNHYYEALKSRFRKYKNHKKQKHSKEEINFINQYDLIIDLFGVDPFSLFVFYVEYNKQIQSTISEFISTDPLKDIQVLIYLYGFFDKIYFLFRQACANPPISR